MSSRRQSDSSVRSRTLGVIYAAHKSGEVRKILLTRTNNHLYYRYRADRDELTVLAVWGAPRERGPKL
jgi:hypothetical protein